MIRQKLVVLIAAVLVFMLGFLTYQYFFPDNLFTNLFTKKGFIRVESRPIASVFIDNELVGQTPLQINVSEGVYTIKLVPQARNESGYLTWSERIRVFAKITTYINRVLAKESQFMAGETLSLEKSDSKKGQVLVSTEPSGLFVSLDGDERGLSPLLVDNIDAGEHEIGIQGKGLQPRTIKINVVEGYKVLASIQLAVDPSFEAKKKQNKEKKKNDKLEQSQTLEILNTPTGWLRVRNGPSLSASESAKLDSGTKVLFFNKENGWYEVEYEEGKRGWVSGDYVKIMKKETTSQ